MADGASYAKHIVTQLKERNLEEHRFNDLIQYSNKLLEDLDYIQKENISRKLVSQKSEDASNATQSKPEDISMLVKCCNLQKELAESHKKVSEYALQIIDFKTQLDDKDKLISAQKHELLHSEESIQKLQEINRNHVQHIEVLKRTLQNKIDECDTLNITYSSLENKKNDLEIENKVLRNEVSTYRSKELAAGFSNTAPAVVPREKKTEPRVMIKLPQPNIAKQLHETMPIKKAADRTKVDPLDYAAKKTDEPRALASDSIPARVKYEITAHDSEVNCVLWVPSSPQLITAGADRKVKLWDMTDSSMELKKIVRDNSAIMSVDLDIEAGLLLCASCDFASRLWTVRDFTIRHTLTGHTARVMSAKFLPIENQIVSGSWDKTLKLWDLRRRTCILTGSTDSYVNDIISKSGHTVISCHANSYINLWDVRTNGITKMVQCSAGVTSLDIAPCGNLLLASQLDNKLALIDLRENKEVGLLFGGGFEVAYDWTRAKFSPDYKYCCCGSKNGCIFVWSLISGSVVKELKAHTAPVISCSWSTCGSYLASCDAKKKCIIWYNK